MGGNLRAKKIVSCVWRASSLHFVRCEGQPLSISSRCPCSPSRSSAVGIVRGPPPPRLAPPPPAVAWDPSRDPGALPWGPDSPRRCRRGQRDGRSGVRRSFRQNTSAENVMSGLSRQLPWAAACLAVLCVLTAAQSPTPTPNTTVITTPATTNKTVPTTVTTSAPVTSPAQGGRQPNGPPVLARPPRRPPCPRCARGRGRDGPRSSNMAARPSPARAGIGVAGVGERPGEQGRPSLGGRWALCHPKVSHAEVLLKSAS